MAQRVHSGVQHAKGASAPWLLAVVDDVALVREPAHAGPHRHRGRAAAGVGRKQLSEVVSGRAGLSPERTIRQGKAFGGGAEAWSRLQAASDLARAMARAGNINVGCSG